VSKAVTPGGYMVKATRAFGSAQHLLSIGDTDGACNRAYYAMFDAAQAALRAANAEMTDASVKTHRGLIAAFGRHLVQGKLIAPEYGAALNQVERLRLLADYTGDPVSLEDATWAVAQAEAFLAAIRTKFFTPPPRL